MAGVDSSMSSQDFSQAYYSLWITGMEPFLDFWVCFCAAGFLGYAALMDWRNRKRKRLVMIQLEDSDSEKPNNNNNHTSSPVFGVARSASDFATSLLSKYIKGLSTSSSSTASFEPSSNSFSGDLMSKAPIEDNSKHEVLQNKDRDSDESPQHTNNNNNNSESSPRPRIPKVLFKPIVEHGAVGNQEDEIPSQPPVLDVRQNNDGRKSLFIPFVGKRLNREFSNTSVNSLPSILKSPLSGGGGGGSIRSFNQSSRSLSSLRLGMDDSLSRFSPKLGDSRNSSPSTEQGDRSGSLKDERFARETWDIALERDECSICFTSLYKEEVAICTSSHGVPVCLHLYHNRCLKVLRHRRCILCGTRFTYRRRLPEVDVDPSGWFQTVDVDQSGGLSPKEIARVLAAQLPIDRKGLEKILLKHWDRWDADHNGEVDKDEFFAPKRGLLAFLKKNRNKFKKLEAEVDPPDIRVDPRGWFEYFDSDKSNSLSRCEVLRALIVSFSLSREPKICLNLRMVLDAVWPIFDSDMNDSISKSEFLEPKTGLATSLVISINLSDRGAAVL